MEIEIIENGGLKERLKKFFSWFTFSDKTDSGCLKGMTFDIPKHIESTGGITYYIYAVSKKPKAYLKGGRVIGHVTVKYDTFKKEGFILNLRNHIQWVGIGTKILEQVILLKEKESMKSMWGKISSRALGFYEKTEHLGVKIDSDERSFQIK